MPTKQVDGQQTQRAAIYIRVSSTGQEDGFSLDTQEAACRQLASARGYVVRDVYREVHTGVELWEREQLNRLRSVVRENAIEAVFCYAIDRLARDPVHLGVVLSEADHYGVEVLFVTEPLDNTSEGQLIRFIRGYAAKVEHEKIKERSHRGRLARAQSGKLLAGRFPLFGYQFADETKSRYAVNPAAAPIVQRIFRLAVSGKGTEGIAMALTRDGIPSPTGKPFWCHQTILKILTNPFYVGHATALRTPVIVVRTGAKRRTVRPAGDEIPLPPGTVPPLVDEPTFVAVAGRLERNKVSAARNNPTPEDSLLRAGFVYCGHCGKRMMVHHSTPESRRPAVYRCDGRNKRQFGCPTPTIPISKLDDESWTRIETMLTRPEVIADQLAMLQAKDPTEGDIAAVERELADVDRRRTNLTRRLGLFDDDDTAAPLVAEIAQLGKRKVALEAELPIIKARRQAWEEAQSKLIDLQAWCRAVASSLDLLTYEQRRLALEALGVRVLVYKFGHTPRWTIEASLPLAENVATTSL